MNESEQQVLEKIEKECLTYFRQNPVWKKVLKGFRDKYSSYGRFGGKVVLKNLKSQDIEELEGFFGKSFHGQKSVTVSAEKFRQALKASRYKDISPKCLLENFFGEPLLGRQEQKLLREQEKEKIWQKFLEDYKETVTEMTAELLRNIVKDSDSQELEEWDRALRLGAEIYNHLPYRQSDKLYLAVFASMMTGNPHAFDNGTAAWNFLYQMIQMDLFAKSEIRVYYAGDLDPEGILIAQKLSQYYKGEFHYWHMETADYEKCRSEEVISPKRMKILERITDGRLKPVMDRIEEYGTAGYQEMLVEEM